MHPYAVLVHVVTSSELCRLRISVGKVAMIYRCSCKFKPPIQERREGGEREGEAGRSALSFMIDAFKTQCFILRPRKHFAGTEQR